MSSKSIYLVAYYFMKPRNRVRTQTKGWMEDQNNIAYDEKVAVARNLKSSDLTTAKVILDLTKKVVVRNGWNNGKDFDSLFEYYHEGYPQYTTTVMNQLDPEYLTKFNRQPEPQNNLTITGPTESIVEVDTSESAKVL